jgi:hypothetical protein
VREVSAAVHALERRVQLVGEDARKRLMPRCAGNRRVTARVSPPLPVGRYPLATVFCATRS